MCGIAGIFSSSLCRDLPAADAQLGSMAAALHHRGPDAQGVWLDTDAGIGLCHRRLSILDLSEAGSQPMMSECGRFVMVFNGEIYNHIAIRSDLDMLNATKPWRGLSDTETLLAAIQHWGLKEALRRARGMFALALWDRRTKILHLARDRMGEKPLYLARLTDGWAFGSELKAILSVSTFEARLCRNAVGEYLAYGYVPDTECILENVEKVQPGHFLSISLAQMTPETFAYETFNDLLSGALVRRDKGQFNDIGGLEKTLGDVVEEQMISDVPLGCFLSGGVDSSLIAAMMQSRNAQPIYTFSIGFSEERFNEAHYAAAVARHLGTEHTEFILSEQDALETVLGLPKIYDEPFADSSQIPTVLLSREVRNFVTVALTGDGGDEVFGGYNRHVIGPQLISRLQRVPPSLRRSVGRVFSAASPLLTSENGWPRRLISRMRMPITAIEKAEKLAPHLGEINDLNDLYQHFTRGIPHPENLTHYPISGVDSLRDFSVRGAEWMMAMDSVTYLPGDILVKVDRAAMAASLETRAPFLDARVLSAAWELPVEMKIAEGKGKKVLRSVLDKHVPRDLIERPKQGFAIPLDQWLRGALMQWAERLIFDEELIDIAELKQDEIQHLWMSHQSGKANNGNKLWILLMLLDWLRNFRCYIRRSLRTDTLPALH